MLRAVLVAAVCSGLPASAAAAVPLSSCVVPATQLLHDTTKCADAPASDAIAVEGYVGERESVQVVVEPQSAVVLTGLQYSLELASGSLEAELLQVGFVNCETTSRYGGSGGGWTSDPLLPIFAAGQQATAMSFNTTAPLVLWVTLTIPAQRVTGKLVLRFGGAEPVEVSVAAVPWNLPPMPDRQAVQKAFPQIWSFDDGYVHKLYGSSADKSAQYLPPDALYKGVPYTNFSYYQYLHNTAGSFLLNVAAIGGCGETYTNATVEKIIDGVAPTIDKLLAQGWDAKPYVYGFDEVDQSCEANIRLLYGAVKKRYGDKVLTVSAMNPMSNWKNFKSDMPIDIIAHQYQFAFSDEFIAEWKAAGKQIFYYHCIEPHGATYLNTFIERPRSQGRALYWYGASQGVTGWLYYATDIWDGKDGKMHTPIRRVSNQSLTDFPPANYIWYPSIPTMFANGDGQFVYPGDAGVVGSARLYLQRDAVEDHILLSAALANPAVAEQARAIIKKVVPSATTHDDSATGIVEARAQIARLLQSI